VKGVKNYEYPYVIGISADYKWIPGSSPGMTKVIGTGMAAVVIHICHTRA
jgi:hypothetical protein